MTAAYAFAAFLAIVVLGSFGVVAYEILDAEMRTGMEEPP